MNKKTKIFASSLMIVIGSFFVYVLVHKQVLSKANQQTAKTTANLDASVYRGGAIS